MSNVAVSLDKVSFSYEKKEVLKNLSAEIMSKRLCFVMGNNGSGKTTLLKTIMGFLVPQSGRIMVAGKDVSGLDTRSMSRLVSYVPQAIQLNTDFKVVDFLALGRTPHIGMINRMGDSDYEIIDKYVVQFGIEGYLNVEFNKLSGGQKQLVSIVRSLIQETPIIIMDEPMSALDLGKQVDLLKSFINLMNQGKTIIMTTHNPNHALSIECDVCFLKDGRIVSFGKNNEVINERLLHNVYGPNIALDHDQGNYVVFNTGYRSKWLG